MRNLGGGTSGPLTSSLSGANADSFPVETDECSGGALAPASSCVITVAFQPTTTGPMDAASSVAGAPGGDATAALTGNGLTDGGPWLSIAPVITSFDDTPVGSVSAGIVHTVHNPSACTIGLLEVAIAGSDPDDFSVTADACTGITLAPGGSCQVAARFEPTAPGPHNATLQVWAGAVAVASLSGTGL